VEQEFLDFTLQLELGQYYKMVDSLLNTNQMERLLIFHHQLEKLSSSMVKITCWRSLLWEILPSLEQKELIKQEIFSSTRVQEISIKMLPQLERYVSQK
jgi:hypothetical protein